MKLIKRLDLQKYQQQDIIQCAKCYNFILIEEQDMSIICPFCNYNMQFYTIKKHNGKLVETLEILLSAIQNILQQDYGIIIYHNNKKMLVRNQNKQILIEQVRKDLNNYQDLTNGKFIKVQKEAKLLLQKQKEGLKE